MPIKFLKDYTVGTPPETFKAGLVLKDRDAASEGHFVRRGVAGYLAADGALTDYEGRVIEQPQAKAAPAAKAPGKPKSKPKSKVKPMAKPAAKAVVPRAETRAAPSLAIGLPDIRLPQDQG